jgi:cyclomaltodextrinase / maltogenic alpha-amylase / neopullulanase
VIHGEFPDWVNTGGLDSVTQYELWKAIWSSLNDGNFFELSWTLDRHSAFCEAFTPLTFVGNHDVTRIANKLTDSRHLAHALVLLFTLPGVPSVYYGDEQAFRGVKQDRAGGDDAVRPAFPAGPELLASEGWPIYRLHQRLIGLRRRHPWLTIARIEKGTVANEQLSYRLIGPGGQALQVMLNIADDAFEFPVDNLAAVLVSDGPDGDADSAVPPGRILSVHAHGWTVVGPAQ